MHQTFVTALLFQPGRYFSRALECTFLGILGLIFHNSVLTTDHLLPPTNVGHQHKTIFSGVVLSLLIRFCKELTRQDL